MRRHFILTISQANELAEQGVVFAACENTMKKKNVSKDQLLLAATTTDSGVAEVVRKEEAGWSYIKSGQRVCDIAAGWAETDVDVAMRDFLYARSNKNVTRIFRRSFFFFAFSKAAKAVSVAA